MEYDDKPVRERFLKPAPLTCVYNDTVKIPENCHCKYFYCHKYKQTILDIHTAHVENGIVINTKGQRVPDSPFQDLCLDRGFVQHYITKSCREWCERRLGVTDACGNVIGDAQTLKRWYFNLCQRTPEKEKIIDDYIRRLEKCDEPVSSKRSRNEVQQVGESEGPRTNKRRTCRQTKPVCEGAK